MVHILPSSPSPVKISNPPTSHNPLPKLVLHITHLTRKSNNPTQSQDFWNNIKNSPIYPRPYPSPSSHHPWNSNRTLSPKLSTWHLSDSATKKHKTLHLAAFNWRLHLTIHQSKGYNHWEIDPRANIMIKEAHTSPRIAKVDF